MVKQATGVRAWLGNKVSRLADWLLYGDGHDMRILDGEGVEIFSVAFAGGYVATGPDEPYRLECCDERLWDEEEVT